MINDYLDHVIKYINLFLSVCQLLSQLIVKSNNNNYQ